MKWERSGMQGCPSFLKVFGRRRERRRESSGWGGEQRDGATQRKPKEIVNFRDKE